MRSRVGRGRPERATLVQRLRDLTPAWPISEHHARQIAERQAQILIAHAGIEGPPVPTEIVGKLKGVHVYPLVKAPVKGLRGSAQPNARGGDILIDSTIPLVEQRVTLLHELKHIIDGDRAGMFREYGQPSDVQQLCTEFALLALMPAAWVLGDWYGGIQSPAELARRYEVPVQAVEDRLHALGLTRRRSQPRRGAICQWHRRADSSGDGNEKT